MVRLSVGIDLFGSKKKVFIVYIAHQVKAKTIQFVSNPHHTELEKITRELDSKNQMSFKDFNILNFIVPDKIYDQLRFNRSSIKVLIHDNDGAVLESESVNMLDLS